MFKVRLYSPNLKTVCDGVSVICRMYTNWGRPNQESQTTVVRLFKSKEVVQVGSVYWP